jgi:hypothetical protein
MLRAVRLPGVKVIRNGPAHIQQRRPMTASGVPDIATVLTCSYAAFVSGETAMMCEMA